MPSVGMRRSTRVFGVVKGVDGARVLRSGRRLWLESGDFKVRRANGGDEWIDSVIKNTTNNSNSKSHKNDSNSNGVKSKENGWYNAAKLKREAPTIEVEMPKRVKSNNSVDGETKRFGVVYSRKRLRTIVEKQENLDDKMYGIQFSRRQRRKTQDDSERSQVLAVVVDSSCCSGLSRFVNMLLSYFRRVSLRLSELAAFLVSEPLSSVFASNGIRFLSDSPAMHRTGMFEFFGARQFVPLFSVDFSAIPLCFVHMHLSLAFRVKLISFFSANNLSSEDECDELSDSELDHSCMPINVETRDTKIIMPEANVSANKVVLHPSVRASKLAGRSTQYRNGLNSRGIQKRRSSLRRRGARNAPVVAMRKSNGALVSDLISSRKNGIPFSSVVSTNKLRSSVRTRSEANLKYEGSNLVGVTQTMDSSSCSANILVTESDRCYRIGGASVILEISDSREWVLVAKKDGSSRYTHMAQKIMRPCSSNRITHDIIWSGDENWKLEFPNRQDWLIFKYLYKECSDRNALLSTPKAIPVPGVREVFGYEDNNGIPFSRPSDAYISVNNDEVARALAKRTPNYDMDSEDEEWLKKFNNEFRVENDCEHLSEDNFELMVDAFEKAFYCSPDDFTDEKAAVTLFMELGRREVVEAVYSCWMKKRKLKRSALLKVYQGHQAKKAPIIPKPVLRKRRSFKRQSSHIGRGKQPRLLKAMAAEQDALEEQNALLKVEEAKVSADKSVESAILTRRRAQLLIENANLAIYKAAMALRIAEAARVTDSTDVALTHFLD